MLRTPPEIESEQPHKCALPDAWDDDKSRWLPIGSYFECDVCGTDYVYKKEWGDVDWYRVRWFNRRKIRERVGIDENCPSCGYRSARKFYSTKTTLTNMRVNYRCPQHEKEMIQHLKDNPPNMSLNLEAPEYDYYDKSWVKDQLKVGNFWKAFKEKYGQQTHS